MSDIHILFENDAFIAADKASGIPTHAPNAQTLGLAEILQSERGIKLGIHQRLDAATSGVLIFSKTKSGAQKLAHAFESRQIEKKYIALTCGIPAQNKGVWVHFLEHRNGLTFQSKHGRRAESRFKVLRRIGPFALLELELLTGLTHQLRVQCALAGCPILGDSLYGGGELYPRLCLHAHQLRIPSIPDIPVLTASLPDPLHSPELGRIISAIADKALAAFPPFPITEAIRLLVPQHSGIPEIIFEKIGSTLLVRHLEPSGKSLWSAPALELACETVKRTFQCSEICLRIHHAPDKSNACASLQNIWNHTPQPHTATENGLIYTFDFTGNASGLYLDQRENRLWIRQHAHGKALNLFAYTCAFSVCAASSANVCETVSIDAAPAALNRGRENFTLNHIDTEQHHFIAQDVLKYLERCAKNQSLFDTVICDPPSFGRFGKIVFSLEKDLASLMMACFRIAAPHAAILFTINHRRIDLSKLRTVLDDTLNTLRKTAECCEVFVNDDATGPLGVGTDLKTIRLILK